MKTHKATRTQITDLPEFVVELSEREMRVISGGLTNIMACQLRAAPLKSTLGVRPATDQWTAPGDHDAD